MYQRAGKIAREMPQLQPVLGATAWCMSMYIHPRGPIRKRYKNLPKGHKLEGLVLVWESNRILQRRGVESPVYYFFYGDFPDVDLFSTHIYIHVVEEKAEECLFIM